MGVVGDGARDHMGLLGAGKPQELVDLVARDVGNDAAGPVPVVKPFRTTLTTGEGGAGALPVRSESQGLHDLANPPFSDQLPGFDRAAHLEALRERNRPESTRLGDRLLDLVELFERDTAGLVRDDVLAVRQGLDRDGGAPVRNRRCDDQIDRRITKQTHWVVDPHHIGPAPWSRRCNRSVSVLGAEPGELATLIKKTLDLPEGMGMVQANRGKPNRLTALLCWAHS